MASISDRSSGDQRLSLYEYTFSATRLKHSQKLGVLDGTTIAPLGSMKRYLTIGILMGAALLTHVSTASAQRWGREATPRSGVCFYEDINFQGRYFCTPVGYDVEGVPSGMNDRVSSARVFGNAVATVFRDPSFRGQAKVIEYDVRDLRGMGFNDRVSSYSVDAGFGRARNGNRNGNVNGNERYGNGNRNRVQSNARWSYRDAETIVRRSYRTVLGRNPDPQGLRNWTEQVMRYNWTERDLEYALTQSDEYRALRNSGNQGNDDDDRRVAVPRRR